MIPLCRNGLADQLQRLITREKSAVAFWLHKLTTNRTTSAASSASAATTAAMPTTAATLITAPTAEVAAMTETGATAAAATTTAETKDVQGTIVVVTCYIMLCKRCGHALIAARRNSRSNSRENVQLYSQ